MTVTINGTTGIANDGGYTGDGVVFADTTPANTLVTTTGGNVGIGTSSPGRPLHVASSSTSYLARFQNSGSALALINFKDNTTSDFNVGVGANGENFVAYTSNTERARIDSSGNLLVGTTSNTSNTGPSIVQQVQSGNETFIRVNHNSAASTGGWFIGFSYNGTAIGSITQNGTTATAYNTSSDYRLKNTIAPMTGALAKVAALKPCTYKWNADDSAGEGFIAHELAEVVPQCVTGEKDAVDAEGNPQYQGIDTSFLVATLTAAIQELKAINDAQAETITALTARVTALENQP